MYFFYLFSFLARTLNLGNFSLNALVRNEYPYLASVLILISGIPNEFQLSSKKRIVKLTLPNPSLCSSILAIK